MTFTLQIGKKRHSVETIAEASRVYCVARDESGLGASKFRPGIIKGEDGKFAARISYNGRVWASQEWVLGETPLCEAQS